MKKLIVLMLVLAAAVAAAGEFRFKYNPEDSAREEVFVQGKVIAWKVTGADVPEKAMAEVKLYNGKNAQRSHFYLVNTKEEFSCYVHLNIQKEQVMGLMTHFKPTGSRYFRAWSYFGNRVSPDLNYPQEAVIEPEQYLTVLKIPFQNASDHIRVDVRFICDEAKIAELQKQQQELREREIREANRAPVYQYFTPEKIKELPADEAGLRALAKEIAEKRKTGEANLDDMRLVMRKLGEVLNSKAPRMRAEDWEVKRDNPPGQFTGDELKITYNPDYFNPYAFASAQWKIDGINPGAQIAAEISIFSNKDEIKTFHQIIGGNKETFFYAFLRPDGMASELRTTFVPRFFSNQFNTIQTLEPPVSYNFALLKAISVKPEESFRILKLEPRAITRDSKLDYRIRSITEQQHAIIGEKAVRIEKTLWDTGVEYVYVDIKFITDQGKVREIIDMLKKEQPPLLKSSYRIIRYLFLTPEKVADMPKTEEELINLRAEVEQAYKKGKASIDDLELIQKKLIEVYDAIPKQ